MPGRAKLLVVEDECDARDNLVMLLQAWGYDPMAAGDAAEAMCLARDVTPDVVVTDLVMPGLDGLALLRLLKELDPRIEVIFLTGHATVDTAVAALREGQAFDYLRKPLEDVGRLQLVIERALVRRHQAVAAGLARPAAAEPSRLAVELSPRERELLGLLGRGLEIAAMAEQLCLSERTVRNHLSNMYGKLGVSNRLQALLKAQQAGLL